MTPKYPDPYQTASAQAGANRDSAITSALVNNYDETGPFGSVKYDQNGFNTYTDANGRTVKVPKFTRTTTLDPAQQALLDKQNQAGANLGDLAVSQSARLNNVLNDPFNPQGLPARPDGSTLANDYSSDRRRVEDAILSRSNEQFDRRRSQTETKLMNQGLTPGSEAWNEQMNQIGRDENDATMAAILAGGSEQSRLAGLDQQKLATQGNLRSSALQEEFAMRNQPINEIAALLSGSSVNVPQFAQAFQQGVGSVPIGDYINSDYEARLAQSNAMMSGLFGLGSSAIKGTFGLSDRRAKKDVERIGETPDDLGVYRFRYKGESERVPRRVGLMAQDVMKKKPQAVVRRPDGMMMVDYAEALA